MLAIEYPYPQFFDLDGRPLDSGFVYIGAENQNPETSPITVYWDVALTEPAAQPLRTLNGMIARAGTPAFVYAATDHSMMVRNSRGVQVVYAPSSKRFSVEGQLNEFEALIRSQNGASVVGFIQAGSGAVVRNVDAKLKEFVTLQDFGAVGNGIADDTAAWNAFTSSNKLRVALAGSYLVNGVLMVYPESVIFSGNSVLTRDQVDDVLLKVSAFLEQDVTDYRGDTLPNAYRRIVQYRRPIGGGPIYEVVAEKSINSTGAGYCLRYFAGVAELYPEFAAGHIEMINRLASLVISLQHIDKRKTRYGGFALAPKDGTATSYNAGMCGLGLLAAYRVTKNPDHLIAARRAAVFLATCNNPNPAYQALYGVIPIPSLPQNVGWNGFCDSISADDTILITHTVWNLLGAEFLKELYDITGDTSYQTLYQNVRNWGAPGVTGFYDLWSVYHIDGIVPAKVSKNWAGTGLQVAAGMWHRRGEIVVGVVQNTGLCTAATVNTITLSAGASNVNDAYKDMAIRVLTVGATTQRGSVVASYNGTTKVATLKYPFPITPAAGDEYTVGLNANTIGTDQMEYGIESLLATGFDITALRAAYETICSWPNATPGPFADAYDPRICWTGFFRPFAQMYGGDSKAFGTQYDVQGIGPLLKFKKLQFPEHWAVSVKKALLIPDVATLVDKDFNTIWSTDPTGLYEFTTVGAGTVKGTVGLGIAESFNA